MAEQRLVKLRRTLVVAQILNEPDDDDYDNGEMADDSGNKFVISNHDENEEEFADENTTEAAENTLQRQSCVLFMLTI